MSPERTTIDVSIVVYEVIKMVRKNQVKSVVAENNAGNAAEQKINGNNIDITADCKITEKTAEFLQKMMKVTVSEKGWIIPSEFPDPELYSSLSIPEKAFILDAVSKLPAFHPFGKTKDGFYGMMNVLLNQTPVKPAKKTGTVETITERAKNLIDMKNAGLMDETLCKELLKALYSGGN